MTVMTRKETQMRPTARKPEPEDFPIRLIDWLAAALERRRQRRVLGEMSDYQLHDIGLSRADVARETAKPFWRV